MKKVLLISNTIKPIYTEKARSLGIHLSLLASKKSHQSFWNDCFDELLLVDNLFDWKQITTILEHKNYDGVLTRSENYVILTAAVAELMRCPGITISQAVGFRNKWLMKKRLQSMNVPVADGVLVSNPEDALEFEAQHSFPLILKQLSGVHSTLIKKISSQEELTATLKEFKQKMGNSEHDLHRELKNYPLEIEQPNQQTHFLLENLLKGVEITVDSFVSNGKFAHTPVCVYTLAEELGSYEHYLPIRTMPWTTLSQSKQKLVLTVVENALTALGADSCACHTELFLNLENDDCHVVEVAARSGGFRAEMLKLTTGEDYNLAAVIAATGNLPDLNYQVQKITSVVEVYSDTEGKLQAIDCSLLEKDKQVVYCKQSALENSIVGPSSSGFRPIVKFIVVGDEFDQTLSKAKLLFTKVTDSISLE